MVSREKREAAIRASPKNVSYRDLLALAESYFGAPRNNGSSHVVFKTPWIGDPRINIQSFSGQARPYQVKQVLAAIDKLKEQHND